MNATNWDALAEVIWAASRRDEGSVSVAGAQKIATAVRAYLDDRDQLPRGAWLRQLAVIDFDLDYGEDAEFVGLDDPRANVVTSLPASHLLPELLDAAEFAMNPEMGTYKHPDALHYPVIDIDFPCHWVPSSTPGHGHLYIDRAIPWTAFLQLLEAMAEAGIVEIGYVAACRREGFASVRLPWVRKDEATAPADGEGVA